MQDSALKFDVETGLESALLWAGALCLVAFLSLLILGTHDAPDVGLPLEGAIGYSGGALVLGFLFLALRLKTDCHYLVNPEKGRIDYNRTVPFYTSVKPFLPFEAIDKVVVRGHVVYLKHSNYIEYEIRVITQQGNDYLFSDDLRDDSGLAEANERGRFLANLIKRPFEAGKPIPLPPR